MKNIMWNVKFEYADKMSKWEWRKQECYLYAETEGEAIKKCKELYGLGIDCEYKIVSAERVGK